MNLSIWLAEQVQVNHLSSKRSTAICHYEWDQSELQDMTLKRLRQKEIPLLRRKLGIIFQDFQLLSDRSVAENIYFVMKATGWKDRAKMKAKISELLMKVGLGAVSTKMPHQLSGGEQQRVVIARALVNEPLLLIADEPTGNLDPEVSEGILKTFEKINNQGTAILMATHDFKLIENYPKRTLTCTDRQIKDSSAEVASHT